MVPIVEAQQKRTFFVVGHNGFNMCLGCTQDVLRLLLGISSEIDPQGEAIDTNSIQILYVRLIAVESNGNEKKTTDGSEMKTNEMDGSEMKQNETNGSEMKTNETKRKQLMDQI